MRDHFTVSLDRFTILWYTFTDASKSSSEGPGSGSIDPFVSLITPLIALRRGIHSKETPWEKQISFFFLFFFSLSLVPTSFYDGYIYLLSENCKRRSIFYGAFLPIILRCNPIIKSFRIIDSQKGKTARIMGVVYIKVGKQGNGPIDSTGCHRGEIYLGQQLRQLVESFATPES